ncbi:MAG: hypothetical protein AAFX50_20480 [Acidobacteriota bacterium]
MRWLAELRTFARPGRPTAPPPAPGEPAPDGAAPDDLDPDRAAPVDGAGRVVWRHLPAHAGDPHPIGAAMTLLDGLGVGGLLAAAPGGPAVERSRA